MCILLFAAGAGAGMIGYLVGLASLISYPALIAAGVPPVLANTSNTVGLLGAGVGSIANAWRRVAAVRIYPHWVQLAVSAAGGLAGGALLVVADPDVFEAVVPWLVLSGAVLVALSPRINGARTRRRLPLPVYLTFLVLITIYGGYFGAGAGVLFFALCMLGTPMTAHEAVLMKTPMLFVSNLTAAILFIARGDVDWGAAVAVGAGAFAGGYAAPALQRFIPEPLMRWLVVAGGCVMTAWLLLR